MITTGTAVCKPSHEEQTGKQTGHYRVYHARLVSYKEAFSFGEALRAAKREGPATIIRWSFDGERDWQTISILDEQGNPVCPGNR